MVWLILGNSVPLVCSSSIRDLVEDRFVLHFICSQRPRSSGKQSDACQRSGSWESHPRWVLHRLLREVSLSALQWSSPAGSYPDYRRINVVARFLSEGLGASTASARITGNVSDCLCIRFSRFRRGFWRSPSIYQPPHASAQTDKKVQKY